MSAVLGEYLDIVFFALAGVFTGLFWRQRLRQPERLSPSGRAWLRIAVIFGAVGVFLVWRLRLSGG